MSSGTQTVFEIEWSPYLALASIKTRWTHAATKVIDCDFQEAISLDPGTVPRVATTAPDCPPRRVRGQEERIGDRYAELPK